MSKPPKTFNQFSERFPKIREGWDLLGEAAKEGPLDEMEQTVAIAASVIGLPSAVAVWTWIRDIEKPRE
ncbi:MAG: hypothetical protein ABR524_09345 [Thermoanaerobaculia bacterium]